LSLTGQRLPLGFFGHPSKRLRRDQEDELSDEDLVVIPLPTNQGGVTWAVARLVSEDGRAFAEAIAMVPDTTFAPPRRIALSRYSLSEIRSGSALRPNLYLYEGMIMPPPPGDGGN
jgi:hypothetical protein